MGKGQSSTAAQTPGEASEMARAKKAKAIRKATRKAKRRPRIPKALRTETRRMRERGRIPQRLLDTLTPEQIDELFPDLDEGDIYD